mgnify:CR=1 FL=1
MSAVKKKKGYIQSIEAIHSFLQKYPNINIHYNIVGSLTVDPPFVAELRELIHTKKMESIVTLHGSVSDATLQNFYLSSDVFLLPSLQEGDYFEGFGLVFLEANLRGTPVIGPTSGGCPEAISDGVSGYVVNPLDTPSIVNALEKTLIQQNISTAHCKKWAMQHDIQASAALLETYYNEIVTGERL